MIGVGSMTGAILNGANFGQIVKAGVVGAFWGGVSAGASKFMED